MSFSSHLTSSSDITYQSTHHGTDEKPKKRQIIFEKELLERISFSMLNKICENKERKDYKRIVSVQSKQIFTSKFIPKMSLGDYLNRIMTYTKIEQPTLVSALIYIDRFCSKNKIILTEYNTHRLLIASVVVSIKYNEDRKYNNEFYSLVAGTDKKQLNQLEREFLYGLDFDLFIDEREFETYERSLLFD